MCQSCRATRYNEIKLTNHQAIMNNASPDSPSAKAVRQNAIIMTGREAIATLLRLRLEKQRWRSNDRKTRQDLCLEFTTSIVNAPDPKRGAGDQCSKISQRLPRTRRASISSLSVYDTTRGSPPITDNPACSSGVAIGIGNSFTPEFTLPVDAFEEKRGPLRRDEHQLLLSRRDRRNILIVFKVPLPPRSYLKDSSHHSEKMELHCRRSLWKKADRTLWGKTKSLEEQLECLMDRTLKKRSTGSRSRQDFKRRQTGSTDTITLDTDDDGSVLTFW
jgi:hypothetical protein